MNRFEVAPCEVGVAKDYGERARLMLGGLGISLKPAGFRDIYRIASRDTKGQVPNYDVNFSGNGSGLRRWVIGVDGVEIGYYATEIFEDRDTGVSVGEVRAVRLAPALRDRGLGSLFFFLSRIELLEEGVDTLRSVVSDESGKITGLLKKCGFTKTSRTVEASGCPVWEMTGFDEKRELLLDFLLSEFCKRVAKVIKGRVLHFDPADVDIDNPSRVSVRDTVLERIGENGGYFNGVSRFVFGYHYSPVSIIQENLTDDSTRFGLQIEGRSEGDKDILGAILSESFPGQEMEIYRYYSRSDGSLPRWEVESLSVASEEDIMKSAQKLAIAGENFFRRMSSPFVFQNDAARG